MSPKPSLVSFENSSILRKFTILFFLISVIPVCILYYLYAQIRSSGRVGMTADDLSIPLIFAVLGVGVGYFAIRTLFLKLINLLRAKKETIKEAIGPEKFQELVDGNENEIAILTRSFSEITSRLEANIRNLEIAKKTLHSVLSRVGEGISSMNDIDTFLTLIVETVTDGLRAKKGALFLLDTPGKEIFVKSTYGIAENAFRSLSIDAQDNILGVVMKTRKPLLIPNVGGQQNTSLPINVLLEEPLLCAPLVLHDNVLGALVVSGKKTGDNFDEEEMNLLYNLALQTAVAIENSRLNEDAEKTYFETISALALAVDVKQPHARGHLDRVSKYVLQIGKKMGLSRQEMQILRDGARIHDIGKIGIMDEILTNPGPLSEDSWSFMRKHPEIGESIIRPIRSLRNLCPLIRHHHERLDGSGYPDGLKGEEIHLLVRILTVADMFDALTTDRPYRQALSIEDAARELKRIPEKIDQRVVDALLESLGENN